MTREPQASMESRTFRARSNILIFNNLNRLKGLHLPDGLACGKGFAQARYILHLEQYVANVVHRPASWPGAD